MNRKKDHGLSDAEAVASDTRVSAGFGLVCQQSAALTSPEAGIALATRLVEGWNSAFETQCQILLSVSIILSLPIPEYRTQKSLYLAADDCISTYNKQN